MPKKKEPLGKYTRIAKAHDLMDWLDAWIKHEKQPDSYQALSETIEDRVKRFYKEIS